jgi:hypothetical protein
MKGALEVAGDTQQDTDFIQHEQATRYFGQMHAPEEVK